jgi:hypothetical protein
MDIQSSLISSPLSTLQNISPGSMSHSDDDTSRGSYDETLKRELCPLGADLKSLNVSPEIL